jgi:hypothetical protein
VRGQESNPVQIVHHRGGVGEALIDAERRRQFLSDCRAGAG